MGILNKKSPKKSHEETTQGDAKTTSAASASSAVPTTDKAVLLSARVSEKAIRAEAAHVYTFLVDASANKVDVKRAVQAAYDVEPTKVRMMNVEGKRTRFGRLTGKRQDYKKALVTLPKGKTISVRAGV